LLVAVNAAAIAEAHERRRPVSIEMIWDNPQHPLSAPGCTR
jgi:hypothetical protein